MTPSIFFSNQNSPLYHYLYLSTIFFHASSFQSLWCFYLTLVLSWSDFFFVQKLFHTGSFFSRMSPSCWLFFLLKNIFLMSLWTCPPPLINYPWLIILCSCCLSLYILSLSWFLSIFQCAKIWDQVYHLHPLWTRFHHFSKIKLSWSVSYRLIGIAVPSSLTLFLSTVYFRKSASCWFLYFDTI